MSEKKDMKNHMDYFRMMLGNQAITLLHGLCFTEEKKTSSQTQMLDQILAFQGFKKELVQLKVMTVNSDAWPCLGLFFNPLGRRPSIALIKRRVAKFLEQPLPTVEMLVKEHGSIHLNQQIDLPPVEEAMEAKEQEAIETLVCFASSPPKLEARVLDLEQRLKQSEAENAFLKQQLNTIRELVSTKRKLEDEFPLFEESKKQRVE